MLLASLLAVGDQALALPRPSRETLAVFDEACLRFPWEEGLHQLRFELNLKAGLLARASGFLEELRSQEDLGLPLDHLEAELEQARAAQVSTAWTEIEDLDELPEAWEKPRGQPVRFAIGATLILLLIAIQAGLFGPRGPREADLANHFLIVCTQPTVVQPGESALQLFRMDLDGRNQERISGQRGCSLFWLEEAEVGVFANWYSDPDQPWLFRMTPKANPKAEWEQVPLQSGAAGFTILGDGFHGGPPEVAGRYAVLKGIRDDGQQAMFLIDPVADTLRQITPLGPWYRTPVWDPIREELIFGAEVDGSRDLWAMKVLEPGMPWRRLTQSPSQDARPAVHGDQILFVRGRGTGPTEGDYAIHLLNRATGQEEVLVSRPWNDFMPRWSPDGRHLCWTSEEFGHFESDIWVMELATRSMRNLTAPLPGRNYECRWGPDSRTVFFVSTSTGEAQVYRARSDNRFIENISRMNGQTVHGWVLPSSVIDRFVE
jgi:dipeptidyl aminopeptidase/acylaminoacyl peptidase